MIPEKAKGEFEGRIKRSGASVGNLVPEQGIRLMLDYFKDVRVDNCEVDDGDMLLFQWGNYNWGDGPSFHCNITRQFTRRQGEDEEDDATISQLSFTFHYAL